MVFLLLTLAAVYVLMLTAMWVLQEHMIYPRFQIPPVSQQPRPPAGVEVLWYEPPTEPGIRVEAWFAPHSEATATKPRPLVLYAHGNGEVIDAQGPVISRYHDLGFSVLLPEYRGYGRSGGQPGQRAIRRDFLAVLRGVVERPEVDADRVLFHGRSLGGAVVADLSREFQPKAMVLESTFLSMRHMAIRNFAPPLLLRHPYCTDLVVQSSEVPLLIMHGSEDQVVPVGHARRLRSMAATKRCMYLELPTDHVHFPGAGHEPKLRQTLGEFLQLADLGNPATDVSATAPSP